MSRIEVMFLPGLDDVVRDELGADRVHQVPGRNDSFWFDHAGPWRPLLQLVTVVAPFAVRPFPVPRPKSLASSEHLPAIVAMVQAVRKLAQASGLAHDPGGGGVVLRFRRSVYAANGWDVLVRLCTRPLSDRSWRVRNVPGAANATVARAMARLTGPRPADRIANLMCGSGTLLIERLLETPARTAVGVDHSAAVLDACAENLDAASLSGRVRLIPQDIGDRGWTEHGPFDVILADPPWGDLVGEHAANEQLHLKLLHRAYHAAAPAARLAILTHEIRQMEPCLHTTRQLWTPASVTRVFHKGHHPRIYLLHRTRLPQPL